MTLEHIKNIFNGLNIYMDSWQEALKPIKFFIEKFKDEINNHHWEELMLYIDAFCFENQEMFEDGMNNVNDDYRRGYNRVLFELMLENGMTLDDINIIPDYAYPCDDKKKATIKPNIKAIGYECYSLVEELTVEDVNKSLLNSQWIEDVSNDSTWSCDIDKLIINNKGGLTFGGLSCLTNYLTVFNPTTLVVDKSIYEDVRELKDKYDIKIETV